MRNESHNIWNGVGDIMSQAFKKFAVFGVALVALGLVKWLYSDNSQKAQYAVGHRKAVPGANFKAPPSPVHVPVVRDNGSAGTSSSIRGAPQNTEGLKALILQEKELLYRRGQDWQGHEAELKRKVSQISRSELDSLAHMAVAEKTDPDERNICVYLLSLAGIQAREALNYVVKAKIPDFSRITDAHAATAKADQEISLRLSALEALDVLGMQNPQEIRQDLASILLVQNENSIKNFAQISLMGIMQGKPGKLSRWLNQLTARTQESL